jgi:arylsulfatase A-like enzyme
VRPSRFAPWAAVALLAAAPAHGEADPARPPIVLITLCSVRADRLSVYGHRRKTAPALEALARDGVLFETAVSAATTSRPAFWAILSGFFPVAPNNWSSPVRPSHVAEVLRAAGYRTAGFEAHGALGWGKERPLGGFEVHRPARPGLFVRAYRERQALAEEYERESFKWVRSHKSEPFFLSLIYGTAHFSDVPRRPMYDPSDDCLAAFAGELVEAPVRSNPRFGGQWNGREWFNQEKPVSVPERWNVRVRYDAGLLCADRRVAGVVDFLKREGIYDRAVVVVVGDHGDALYEHGFAGHGGPPFDELCRVPLVIKFPGNAWAGRRVHAQVRTVDIAPTLLAAAGVPEPDASLRRDGTSLLPWVSGKRTDGLDACLQSVAQKTEGVRTGDGWKYFRNVLGEVRGLYVLRKDRAEKTNLADRNPRQAGLLEERLLECAGW